MPCDLPTHIEDVPEFQHCVVHIQIKPSLDTATCKEALVQKIRTAHLNGGTHPTTVALDVLPEKIPIYVEAALSEIVGEGIRVLITQANLTSVTNEHAFPKNLMELVRRVGGGASVFCTVSRQLR